MSNAMKMSCMLTKEFGSVGVWTPDPMVVLFGNWIFRSFTSCSLRGEASIDLQSWYRSEPSAFCRVLLGVGTAFGECHVLLDLWL